MKKILLPLLLVVAILGITVPSLISYKLENVVEIQEKELLQHIPNNDSLYAVLYQQSLSDSAQRALGLLQVRVTQAEGLLSHMMTRLDSADERRKNKSYDFLVKEGLTQEALRKLTEVDSLMQEMQPGRDTGMGLYPPAARSDSTWKESFFTGQAFTARTYVTRWVEKLKLAERKVLEGL